jgi:hypothetical protein
MLVRFEHNRSRYSPLKSICAIRCLNENTMACFTIPGVAKGNEKISSLTTRSFWSWHGLTFFLSFIKPCFLFMERDKICPGDVRGPGLFVRLVATWLSSSFSRFSASPAHRPALAGITSHLSLHTNVLPNAEQRFSHHVRE